MNYLFCISALLLHLLLFSCKKNSDKITTDPQAKLTFSQTEITFDTIFTSIGSITQRLWVYNTNSHALNISRIQLAKLNNSSYTLTLNGEEKLELSDYELKGKDSLLILVKVLIDPQNQSLAYLVDDSIVFTTNGTIQDVDLLAYGQDAHFFTNEVVPCNTLWTNTKPYVITSNLLVPAGCTLTIDLGARIRFHKDATLTVAGTLLVSGAEDSIVTFTHDNLSNYYAETPGQWGGIILKTGSKNNCFKYVEIRNATTAIYMEEEIDSDTIAELKIENSVVKNCSKNGVIAIATDFYAVNSLFNNCVDYVFSASSGGNYYFDFCTLANYTDDLFRNSPILKLSNQDASISNPIVSKLRNTILWGDKAEEISLNNNGSSGFAFSADYCILKSTLVITNKSSLFNQNPLFTNEYAKQFSLESTSPGIDSGIALALLTTDLLGKARDANPDRGCYEK